MLQKKKTKKSFLGKRIKNAEEPKRVLFKVKPLEKIRQVKRKKPSKPVKSLVKTTVHPQPSSEKLIPINIIKPTKPKKPELVKQIESSIYKLRVKIIGIGGGGSSIISEIPSKTKGVSFVAVDTDPNTFNQAHRKIKCFRLNQKLAQGLEREKVKNLFRGIDLCIFVSSLGGRTGSEVSSNFAEISREFKNITLGIFVLPFEFEGKDKVELAGSSLEKIRLNLNASVVISNQNLFKIVDEKISLKEALFIVNKHLAESLEGLIESIYSSDLFHIDFTDLKAILDGRGKFAFFNTIETKVQRPVRGIARKVLYNRLSPYLIFKAKRILFNITGGKNLSLNEVNQIGSTITNLVNPRAKVIFGITQDKKYEDKIKIVLLASDCQWQDREKEKPKKKTI